MERITVNLTTPASQALMRTMDITEENKTDIVNHSILIYAIIREALDRGGEVYIKPDEKSDLQRVLII